MKLWVQGRQLVAAMDAVMREWARQLGLSERDVFLLMILEVRGPSSCTDLAADMGRTRQQVQKNLLALERRDIVCPAEMTEHGRVQKWTLSPRGQRVTAVLSELSSIWEAHLLESCDFELLAMALRSAQVAFVNSWRDPRGWGAGLATPTAMTRSEARTVELLETLDVLREELRRQPANDAENEGTTSRERLAKENGALAERAAEDAFNRLWRD